MEISSFIIFTICLFGCSYYSRKEGLKVGAEETINRLHQAKIISYDDKGNIVPNPFYNA